MTFIVSNKQKADWLRSHKIEQTIGQVIGWGGGEAGNTYIVIMFYVGTSIQKQLDYSPMTLTQSQEQGHFAEL